MQTEKSRPPNRNFVITHAGDRALFKTLDDAIVRDLPSTLIEWRPPLGRPPKTILVKTNFVEFEMDKLADDHDVTSLIGKQFLHTFWTDCADSEIFKTSLKQDITTWLESLKSKKVDDWLVVVVEGGDAKKGNKPKLLTRGSVLDKIKHEFCKKQPDRCIGLSKSENVDSWHALLHRLRHLLLKGFNRHLTRFIDNVKSQRENRNALGWNFCDHFLLQEELAFVYEMLGIYDEALVQYDELDAVFTQFVINSNLGDTRDWLLTFSGPCLCWEGLSLAPEVGVEKRRLIEEGKATLLDLRNYMFSRQCALLLLLSRPWELAKRFLTVTYSCINELQFLEVEMPIGAVACWVFLSSLEILQTCEKFKDTNQEDAHFYFTASLWATARSRLQELGNLCGLMPGEKASSKQLHHVVELVAGMGVDRNYGRVDTPLAKLKEALSSNEAFQKQYLELSELAIGTLKHIGRIRYARLIGRDLAEFYRKLGVAHNSAGYLLDDLKTFQEERWDLLGAHTLLRLAECYSTDASDRTKFINIALLIASSPILDVTEREKYFDEAERKISECAESGEQLRLNMADMLEIEKAEIINPDDATLTIDSAIRVKLRINCRFPKRISCDSVVIAVNESRKNAIQTQPKFNRTSDVKRRFTEPLQFVQELTYLEDKNLERVAIVAVAPNNNPLIRQTSNTILPFEGEVVTRDFQQSLRVSDVVFEPGANEIILDGKCQMFGSFLLTQLMVKMGHLELILPQMEPMLTYDILFEPISLTRVPNDKELVAGIPQEVELRIYSGTSSIARGTEIRLEASSGLLIKSLDTEDEMKSKLSLQIDALQPFESWNHKLTLFSNFGPQKDASTIHGEMKIRCPWAENLIDLQFVPPFVTLHKLHTMHTKKFIHITVHCLNVEGFELKNPNLICDNPQITSIPFNIPNNIYVIKANEIVYFLWELVTNVVDHPNLDLEFAIDYSYDSLNYFTYKQKLAMHDYKTLFIVNYKVEPRNSEFCRAGSMCNMSIKIVRNTPSGWSAIMYEVLADQTSWAVCGHTAAVVNMESSVQFNVALDVMPLTSGFLPLPVVRLSKFIPADKMADVKDSPKRVDSAPGFSRLEPFNQGQVYNASAGSQVHVIPAFSSANVE